MSNHWVHYLALLAALVVGYGVFVSSTEPMVAPPLNNAVQGYYLRDAVITETGASGAPRLRVAAAEVTQNLAGRSVELTALRVDYLAEASRDNAAHWVLNADEGIAPNDFRKLALKGNVQAHNLGAPRAIVLDAPALDVDMNAQTAATRTDVQVAIDANVANGRGLLANLRDERLRLQSNVGIRLAQANEGETKSRSPDLSLPDTFEAESFEYVNNVWTLKKVRSKTPPYIEADTLRATGADLANNRIALEGSVKLELPKQGWLTADKGIVTVRNNRVAHAHVSSAAPERLVEFQHRRKDSDQLVHGRAREIDYDVLGGTLRLEGDGWFSDEQGEWSMERLDYNIVTEAARGTRNTIKINPRRDPSGEAKP